MYRAVSSNVHPSKMLEPKPMFSGPVTIDNTRLMNVFSSPYRPNDVNMIIVFRVLPASLPNIYNSSFRVKMRNGTRGNPIKPPKTILREMCIGPGVEQSRSSSFVVFVYFYVFIALEPTHYILEQKRSTEGSIDFCSRGYLRIVRISFFSTGNF